MKKYIALHNISISDYQFYINHKALYEFLYTKQYQSVYQIQKNLIPVIIRDHINLPEYSNKLIPYLDKQYLESTLDYFVNINIAKSYDPK